MEYRVGALRGQVLEWRLLLANAGKLPVSHADIAVAVRSATGNPRMRAGQVGLLLWLTLKGREWFILRPTVVLGVEVVELPHKRVWKKHVIVFFHRGRTTRAGCTLLHAGLAALMPLLSRLGSHSCKNWKRLSIWTHLTCKFLIYRPEALARSLAPWNAVLRSSSQISQTAHGRNPNVFAISLAEIDLCGPAICRVSKSRWTGRRWRRRSHWPRVRAF